MIAPSIELSVRYSGYPSWGTNLIMLLLSYLFLCVLFNQKIHVLVSQVRVNTYVYNMLRDIQTSRMKIYDNLSSFTEFVFLTHQLHMQDLSKYLKNQVPQTLLLLAFMIVQIVLCNVGG